MCRVLGYLGPSVTLEDLMLRPENSLINQSFDPEYHHLLQLGGTGFASWESGSPNEDEPFIYRSSQITFSDRNLKAICRKTRTNSLLAHIRATSYSDRMAVNDQNCHPFMYPGFSLALAHNGVLPGWRAMLHDILSASKPEIVAHLSGSTDTEPMYCLLMSQFDDPRANMGAEEIIDGLQRFMKAMLEIKHRHGNVQIAKLKFFMADGNDLVVANMGLGPDYAAAVERSWDELRTAEPGTPDFALAGVVEPAWYLAGDDYDQFEGTYQMRVRAVEEASTVIIASEHLTEEHDEWQQVPFQHVVYFSRQGDHCALEMRQLNF